LALATWNRVPRRTFVPKKEEEKGGSTKWRNFGSMSDKISVIKSRRTRRTGKKIDTYE
jgi:hypothetical protein